MRLQSLKARLNKLLEAQGPPDGPPSTIIVLPGKHHERDQDAGLPLPRLAWRNRVAACVVYDAKVGQPDSATVARLVAEAVPS